MANRELPYTVIWKDYKIVQATNCHVTIFRLSDGRRVFHNQCNKPLDFAEMVEQYRFYEMMKEVR